MEAPAGFCHLHVHSAYSFLDGAGTVGELVRRAAELELPALALTDRDGVYGVVELLEEAGRAGIRPVAGAEVTVAPAPGLPPVAGPDGRPVERFHLTLLADGPEGYASLCRLLTRAHLDGERGRPCASWEVLAAHARGIVALSGCRRGETALRVLRRDAAGAAAVVGRLAEVFGREQVYVEMVRNLLPGDRMLLEGLEETARRAGVGTVATNDVHYPAREDFFVHDLLTCVRTRVTVDQVHPERRLNAENWLKPPAAMAALFRSRPRALAGAAEVAARCRPPFDLGRPRHPSFRPAGPAEELLRRLAHEGARARYGRVTAAARERLERELAVIGRLGFADYFLIVADVVRYARSRGIRCAGRGSAADSLVAYCLGITEVDALARGLLFERFLSPERGEPPDIDVDFDARYRDEVAAYVIRRHGADRVAAVCTYSTFQGRSAVRELGRALALPAGEVDALARRLPWIHADEVEKALERVPELREWCRRLGEAAPGSGGARRRYRLLLDACARVAGLPRHLGTHLGGLVMGPGPLTDLTPLERAAKGVTVCQFDKRWVEALGLLKLDLLSLRALSVLEDAARAGAGGGASVRAGEGADPAPGPAEQAANTADPTADTADPAGFPLDDPETFAMIRRGETIGVFQLESPAQRALQPRLGAEGLEDLVASVALIRPGPIKGDMVEPYVARRRGLEPVTYLHPLLEPILSRTHGVVLFQEQVIEIARRVAGFTAGEADALRRVMSHARSRAAMEEIGRLFVERALANGVDRPTAEAVFACVAGYASYGFCEAHAAAFALTAYRTAYLARHRPAAYFAALLNHQPMGYYPPHVLAVEARRRGVAILPPDVNRSEAACTVEARPAGEAAPAAGMAGLSAGTAGLSAGTTEAGAGRGGEAAAIRLGLGLVKGLRRAACEALVRERKRGGPFRDLADLLRRLPSLARDEVEALVLSGACDRLAGEGPAGNRLAKDGPTANRLTGQGPAANRRALLWQARGLTRGQVRGLPQGLMRGLMRGLAGGPAGGLAPHPPAEAARSDTVAGFFPLEASDLPVQVPDFSPAEKAAWEMELLGVPVTAHPLALLRPRLRAAGFLTSADLAGVPAGEPVKVAGIPVRPHRPPTRSGRTVVFLSLEDEHGLAEVTVFERVYRRYGHLLFPPAPLLAVYGRAERRWLRADPHRRAAAAPDDTGAAVAPDDTGAADRRAARATVTATAIALTDSSRRTRPVV